MRSNAITLIVIGVVLLVGLVLAANLGSGPSAGGGWYGGPSNPAAMQRQMADFQQQQEAYRAMSNMQQMQHDTTMTIIHNMGNGACRIGVDPNCQ